MQYFKDAKLTVVTGNSKYSTEWLYNFTINTILMEKTICTWGESGLNLFHEEMHSGYLRGESTAADSPMSFRTIIVYQLSVIIEVNL